MIQKLIEHLAHSLGSWAYVLVSVMAIAETAAFVGFIAPGEFTIIVGGVLAGEGTLSIGLLIGIVWASIVIGDTIGFMLGRRLGRRFAIEHGHRVRLSEERIKRVEGYFARHGGKTIFAGRWIGFVRPLMPFTAGASGMEYRRFIPYDILSAGLFGTTFCLLGYIFWQSLGKISAIAGRGALGLGILAALVVAGVWAYKRLRDPANRRRLSARLERIPGWRFLRPPLRFLGQRLTPGELGIEFTTLLAITVVAGYVFGLYTHIVQDNLFGTPGDDFAADVARDIQSGVLTALAKAVSLIGTWPFALVVVLGCSGWLVMKGRLWEAALPPLGLVLTQIGVQMTKAAVDRPRPADPLVSADGSSFPSGHAATAIVYLGLGVILARSVKSATGRVAMVVVAVVPAALIGLSGIYLRVHYLSDVTGGWALGLAVFATCGAVGLVVSYLRNNARSADRVTAG